MANLLPRVSSTVGEYKYARADLFVIDPNIVGAIDESLIGEGIIPIRPGPEWDEYKYGSEQTATMDVLDPAQRTDILTATEDANVQTGFSVYPGQGRGEPAVCPYIEGSTSRLNEELGMDRSFDSMVVQWEDAFGLPLLGSFEEFGAQRTAVSASASLFIDWNGVDGGLDPDDPTEIPDDPVDPGDDPDVIVVGGIETIEVTVNPNSVYTLKLQASEGMEITGVSGLDQSMSWNQLTKTLSGWMLGPGPKTVQVGLGGQEATVILRAGSMPRHAV